MINLIKRVLLIVVLAGLTFTGISQDKIPESLYNAATIPDSLKLNANFVTRYEDYRLEVQSSKKAIASQHIIMTLLNEKSEDKAVFHHGYDNKFYSIKNPEMLVYDAKGALIKRYKKSDMYDRSAYDGMTLVSDNRVLYLKHTVASYPVTIEIKYEYVFDSYLDLSGWFAQEEENSIELAKCTVLANPEVGFRYNAKHFAQKPVKRTIDGFEEYAWVFKNLKAIKPEPGSRNWTFLPCLDFATDKIAFGGIEGDLSSWKGFGMWQQELNKGMSELPPERVEELKQMVSSLPTDKEKAKFLYEYMQKNMRYVGIQLGIGGWRPFPATFVDQKKYGDCKALSNYMHTLLKAVGIPSYYAVIRAGENEPAADPKFVNSPFNHIVLCIPFKNDTTWLECTSNTAAFGKLGTFTENRNALLVTEDGGRLVNTPRSRKEDNVFDSEVLISFNEEGNAKAKVLFTTSGESRDTFIGHSYKSNDDQKKAIISAFNLRQPDIFEIKPVEDKNGIKKVDLELEYEKLSDFSAGTKFFYRPRVFDLWQNTLPVIEKRKTDFFFPHPMIKKCKTVFQLPANLEVEALPAEAAFKFSYGSYETKYLYDKEKNEVTATAIFEINNHVIPAAKYFEMQLFIDNVLKSMSKKLIIRKKV